MKIDRNIGSLSGVLLMVVTIGILRPQIAAADEVPIASGQQANGKVRAEILSVKHTEGDTLTLRFAIVNEGNQPLSMALGNMRLVDLVNRRLFSPGVSSPSCRTEPGEHTICWAVFASPNPNVKTINVQFYEGFDLISVPLAN